MLYATRLGSLTEVLRRGGKGVRGYTLNILKGPIISLSIGLTVYDALQMWIAAP